MCVLLFISYYSLDLSRCQKITSRRNTVVLERRNCVGQYDLTVDIDSEFGFHLPLQLTKNEALEAMSVAKVSSRFLSLRN